MNVISVHEYIKYSKDVHVIFIYFSVIKSLDFLEYRKQIKEIFPSENADVYYRSSIFKDRKDLNRIYVPAGGRLYERYKNVLKQHRELENVNKENIPEEDIEPSESN